MGRNITGIGGNRELFVAGLGMVESWVAGLEGRKRRQSCRTPNWPI